MSRDLDELLGLDLRDVGENILSGTHMAGKVLLSAFGAGGLVAPLESLESPVLKDWAKSTPSVSTSAPQTATVGAPDFVVVAYVDANRKPEILQSVDSVSLDGKRFAGQHDYKRGDTGKFSFGYDAPTRVEVTSKGKKVALTGVRQVLFGGGAEAATHIAGADMDDLEALSHQILGEIAPDDVDAVGEPMDQYFGHYQTGGTPNAYWKQPHASGLATAAQQRLVAAQALQAALRAQQTANYSAIAQQARASGASVPAPPLASSTFAPQAPTSTAPPTNQPDPYNSDYPADGAADPSAIDNTTVMGPERSLGMEIKDLSDKGIADLDRNRASDGEDLEDSWTEVVGTLAKRPLSFDEIQAQRQAQQMVDAWNKWAQKQSGSAVDHKGERPHSRPARQKRSPYIIGADVIGASVQMKRIPPRAGIQLKTAPVTGRKFTSLGIRRATKHDPQKTVNVALAAADKAKKIGNTALTVAGKLAKIEAKTKVKGLAPAGRPTGRAPVKKLGSAALKTLAQKTIEAGKKLRGTAGDLNKKIIAAPAGRRAAIQRGQQATKIHGDVGYTVGATGGYTIGDDGYTVGEGQWGARVPDFGTHAPDFGEQVIGDAWVEVVGEAVELDLLRADLVGESPIPDPFRPGLMTDGSPDPSYGGGSGSTSSSSAGDPYAASASAAPGPPDYGANAVLGLTGPPTIADAAARMASDGEFEVDPHPAGDDSTVWHSGDPLPLGHVVYDGQQQPPHMGLGSYTAFFQQLPGSGPPKGGPGSGYSYHADGMWWLELMGTQPSTNYSGNHNFDHVQNPDGGMAHESEANNWGPLMGNPNTGWTRGLRFVPNGPDGGGALWFWYFDKAPDWAKQPILQARLNDMLVEYHTAVVAGQADFVNQQIQDGLDAKTAADVARRGAAQDADLALQFKAQDAQQVQWEQQQTQQQAQQQSQYEAQQMQFGQQAQAAQLQNWQQQQAQAAQENQMQLDYFQQNPGAMFAPYGGGSGGDEDGVDWGDDGDRNIYGR